MTLIVGQIMDIEKRNVDQGLALGQHLILVQNLGGINLIILNNLDCPIKG